MTYSVKEIFYTLQGEGHHAGRPAVFCRFAGCNLWNGAEASRASALCQFCDTDFVGTDGPGGGKFRQPHTLAERINALWPKAYPAHKYVVFTGGEPLLQLDVPLIEALHAVGFEVAIETNGALIYGWLPLADLLETLRNRPSQVHVVLTGRRCPPEIIALADTVTEMQMVKHAFKAGIPAQRGIED